ncbi:hypothetical protein K474DRAFT_1710839 [Panus rudis PR-1116 ss-1]|nr:hypothetical protein K474DRAFT_1710839 [Panus rudis PR-1116 ss-1]
MSSFKHAAALTYESVGSIVARLKKDLKASPYLLTYSHLPEPSLVTSPYPSDEQNVMVPPGDLVVYERDHEWLSNVLCLCELIRGERRHVCIFTVMNKTSEHYGDVCIGCTHWRRSSPANGSPGGLQSPGCPSNRMHALKQYPRRYASVRKSGTPVLSWSPLTQRIFASPSEITLPSLSLPTTPSKRPRSDSLDDLGFGLSLRSSPQAVLPPSAFGDDPDVIA